MASKAAKVLLGLVALAGLGAVAYAGGEALAEPKAAGMEISEDCQVVTVVDIEEFVLASNEYFLESNAEQWFDPDARADVEQLLRDFLAWAFPQCYPPIPDDFVWVTNVPETWHRTWEETVDDLHLALAPAPGLEAAGEGYDLGAAVQAITRGGAKIPTPEDPFPVAPEASMEPQGAAGDVMPENVVQTTNKAHMLEYGIDVAMEPAGTTSPQRSAVYLVYDPEYPELDALIGDVYDLARDEPDVLWVLASSWDTQGALGVPEKLGTFGYAFNAASPEGVWLQPQASQAEQDRPRPTGDRWEQVLDHAAGPQAADVSFAMG